AGGCPAAGVALGAVVALDVRAMQVVAAGHGGTAQLEEGEARHPVPLICAVPAEVTGRAAVVWLCNHGRLGAVRIGVVLRVAGQVEHGHEDGHAFVRADGVLDVHAAGPTAAVRVTGRGHVLPRRQVDRRLVRREDGADDLAGAATRRVPVEPAAVAWLAAAQGHSLDDGELPRTAGGD